MRAKRARLLRAWATKRGLQYRRVKRVWTAVPTPLKPKHAQAMREDMADEG